jgi:hypothetical protein
MSSTSSAESFTSKIGCERHVNYDAPLAFALAYDAQRHSDGYAHQHGSSLYEYLRDRQRAKSRATIAKLESKIMREIRLLERFLPTRPRSASIYPWKYDR